MSEPLLMSKCRVPSACRGMISRPRLLARLAPERGARLIVVSAPAGFGKTTLMADWARSRPGVLGWLSLDELDDDLHRFWSYFGAVLDALLRARGDNLRRFRAPRGTASSVAGAIAHQLERLPCPCDFVVDDFHFLQDREVLASVNVLVQRLPERCRLLVASRERPRLALSRLHLRGDLEEVTARDLRFDREETVRFCKEVAGWELTRDQARALQRTTEGWPAALRLAVLARRERGGRLDELLAGGSAGRYVFDYLAQEVFESQDEEVRRFLLFTSILRRFCVPLCVAVTGLADSARLLHNLERSDLFLVSLGGEMRWYRYHRLFGRFLRACLEETFPEDVGELHRRAADWYESKGLLEDALQHAAACGGGKRLPARGPLSRRETEVLKLLARGESNKEIARRLGVSLSTVKTHLGHIYEKLEARSRTQAVSRARRLSLLDDAADR